MYRDPRCALSQEQTLLDQLRALATDDPDFFSDLIEGETNLLELIGGLDASIVDDETLIDGVKAALDKLQARKRAAENRIELKTGLEPPCPRIYRDLILAVVEPMPHCQEQCVRSYSCWLPETGSVLGIDIGCSPIRRSSAACRLDWNLTSVALSIERFRAFEPERSLVLRRVANRPILAAAFDGPLSSDLEVIPRYRVAEQLLTQQLRPFIGKPGQASSPIGRLLNSHANACAKIVLEIGVVGDAVHDHAIHASAIVEAFPSSFLGLLIEGPLNLQARRSDRSDNFYVHLAQSGGLLKLLQHLLPRRRLVEPFETVANHDDRAAVVCALTALCVAAGDYSRRRGWLDRAAASLTHTALAWVRLSKNAAGTLPEEHIANINTSAKDPRVAESMS